MATLGAFIVKERLEALENRIDTALDEAGLKDFSKQVARQAVDSVVEEIAADIQSKKDSALDEIKVVHGDLNQQLANFEAHLVRLERMTKISLLMSAAAVVLSYFL